MSKTFVCAHRGASGTQPENTLEAFNEAIKLGCEMIEFDVRMTKDEHLVLLHDPLVDRTTNGNGPIWELLYSETLKSKKMAMKREYQIKKNNKLRTFLRKKIK